MLKLTKFQIIQLVLLYSLLIAVTWLYFNLKQLWGPTRKRPFECFDESLSKPFVAEDTITPEQLNMLSIYVPLMLLAVSEFTLGFCQRNSHNKTGFRVWFLMALLRYAVILSLFLFGLAVERLTKNIAKQKMARLRPNFLTVCEPMNADGVRCSNLEDTITMTEYECARSSYPQWAINTAFHSFPSGHTSLSAYGMIFMACYLHLIGKQLKKSQACLLLLFRIMQVLCVMTVLFVAASRVFDFRHHVSDVCAGFLLGSMLAVALNCYLRMHLHDINAWLSKVFTLTPHQDSINIIPLNGTTLPEKEPSYNMV